MTNELSEEDIEDIIENCDNSQNTIYTCIKNAGFKDCKIKIDPNWKNAEYSLTMYNDEDDEYDGNPFLKHGFAIIPTPRWVDGKPGFHVETYAKQSSYGKNLRNSIIVYYKDIENEMNDHVIVYPTTKHHTKFKNHDSCMSWLKDKFERIGKDFTIRKMHKDDENFIYQINDISSYADWMGEKLEKYPNETNIGDITKIEKWENAVKYLNHEITSQNLAREIEIIREDIVKMRNKMKKLEDKKTRLYEEAAVAMNELEARGYHPKLEKEQKVNAKAFV